jgi:hypothetical protein
MSQLKSIKVNRPEYVEVIPSNKREVKISPFRVADEKNLMVAANSENSADLANAIENVVENCITGVEVDELAPFDIEYLFLKLRSVSVGESTDLGLKCSECKETTEVNVDLKEIKIKESPDHNPIIKINKELGFEMKYMTLKESLSFDGTDEEIFAMVASSVKTVFWGDETITVDSTNRKDLEEIISELTSGDFEKITNFFDTMPKLSETIDFACSKCGHQNEITVEGMQSFF